MKHIAKIALLACIILFFNFQFSIFNSVWAQEISVQAPKQVYLGDNFTVSFVINGDADNFHGPTFKGFSLRSGPNRSFQQSFSNINGRMSQSIQTIYSYRLIADAEGSFTVGSANCTVDGKKVTSNTFSIKVEKMSQAHAALGEGVAGHGYSARHPRTADGTPP